jgi:hypothetical protein
MSGTKTALTMFGGAAALAVAVGFGGIAANTVANALPASLPTTSGVTPALPNAATPGSPSGNTVHHAVLTGCISGLDC